MKHRYRFILPASELAFLGPKDRCKLIGNEFVHLHQVLRLPVGSEVELVDGQGTVATALIEGIVGKRAELSIVTIRRDKPPTAPLIAAFGALKPGFIDDLLPGLCELGCDEIHVFLHDKAARTRMSEKTQERWQAIIHAAAKQCKRGYFPRLHTWAGLSEFLSHARTQAWELLYLDPSAARPLMGMAVPEENGRCFVVGGEKGLEAAEEAQLAASGFIGVHLGPLILRAYTAILASAAILAGKRSL